MLDALRHLGRHGIQEGVVGVMPQGGVGPQGVGHLLGLEALDGQHCLLRRPIQQLRPWVLPQRGKRPQRVGYVLHQHFNDSFNIGTMKGMVNK